MEPKAKKSEREAKMGTINVLLAGGLKVNGVGQGRSTAKDGTFRLALEEGSTVCKAVEGMGLPAARVALAVLNGQPCTVDSPLNSGDRLLLASEEVAAMWRFVCRQDLGMGIGRSA
jgi:hypothetical protein